MTSVPPTAPDAFRHRGQSGWLIKERFHGTFVLRSPNTREAGELYLATTPRRLQRGCGKARQGCGEAAGNDDDDDDDDDVVLMKMKMMMVMW